MLVAAITFSVCTLNSVVSGDIYIFLIFICPPSVLLYDKFLSVHDVYSLWQTASVGGVHLLSAQTVDALCGNLSIVVSADGIPDGSSLALLLNAVDVHSELLCF